MTLLHVSMLAVSSRSVWIQCSWRMLNEQHRRMDLGWYFSMGRKVSVLLQLQSFKEASKCTSIWFSYAWKNLSLHFAGCESTPNRHLSFGFSLLCLPQVMFLWFVGLLCRNCNHSFYIYHETVWLCSLVTAKSGWTESKNDPNSPPFGTQFHSVATPTLHYVKLTLPLPK